jgi:hypothetical protein
VSIFSRSTIPTLPLLGLSEDEQQTIKTLQAQAMTDRSEMLLAEAYYLGEQVIQNLRIAVPKELEFLRTIVGWAAHAVDPYAERSFVDGFRIPSATDADSYLTNIWAGNGLDAELPVAITDALSMSRALWMVGSPLEKGDVPRITVESPLNMTVLWDLRGIRARAAMAEYLDENNRASGSLVLPRKTVHLATDDNGQWVVTDRDEHGFDFVPVHRMANQPRTNNRNGRSAITPALRSLIDATCRTLLGLEVARELYSVPQKTILGASEAAFQKSDGTPKSAWDTYITRVLGLERDEDGNLPEIHQAKAYDPSVFTKLVEGNASQAASIVLAPPQDFGLYTQGNPVSADALNTAESRRNRRARLQHATFGVTLANVMRDAARFDNNGDLPDKFRRIEVDWCGIEESSIAELSDGITKQVAAGIIPPTSDVTLKRLNYSAVERARLEQDRKRADGRAAAQAIAASLTPPTVPVVPGDNAGL